MNFGADKNSSLYIDNKKKYILNLGEGPTQITRWHNSDCRKKVFNKYYWA